MDGGLLEPELSKAVHELSEDFYDRYLRSDPTISYSDRHGFGELALAFAFHSNTPDNSIPAIWKEVHNPSWKPLFPRASRII